MAGNLNNFRPRICNPHLLVDIGTPGGPGDNYVLGPKLLHEALLGQPFLQAGGHGHSLPPIIVKSMALAMAGSCRKG